MLLTPSGLDAGEMDRIMLLAIWVQHLQQEGKTIISETEKREGEQIISAGMGKPTYPIDTDITKAGVNYWSELDLISINAHSLFNNKYISKKECETKVIRMNAAVDYGNAAGDVVSRAKIAKAFTVWYGVSINEDHIIFSVGGAGAINSIFAAIEQNNSKGKMVLQLPYYTLYAADGRKERIQPIYVLGRSNGKTKNTHMTANELSISIEKARKSKAGISAILINDPNNPLGTRIGSKELYKIAKVLENGPNVPIILDEAYAEMILSKTKDEKKHISLLSIVNDAVRKRIIVMRSATKALSAAGERMAAMIVFDQKIREKILAEQVKTYGHAPRSLQYIYAEAMQGFTKLKRQQLVKFYKSQVNFVVQKLKQMGALLAEPKYRPNATFYVIADLGDLIDVGLPKSAKRALGNISIIRTDEHIAYALLLEHGLMIAPLSYFGVDEKLGLMRITCSVGIEKLQILLDKLSNILYIKRKEKSKNLELKIKRNLQDLESLKNEIQKEDCSKIKSINNEFISVRQLRRQYGTLIDGAINRAAKYKSINDNYTKLLSDTRVYLKKYKPQSTQAVGIIQAYYRGYTTRKKLGIQDQERTDKWKKFVEKNFRLSCTKNLLFQVPKSDVDHFLQELPPSLKN